PTRRRAPFAPTPGDPSVGRGTAPRSPSRIRSGNKRRWCTGWRTCTHGPRPRCQHHRCPRLRIGTKSHDRPAPSRPACLDTCQRRPCHVRSPWPRTSGRPTPRAAARLPSMRSCGLRALGAHFENEHAARALLDVLRGRRARSLDAHSAHGGRAVVGEVVVERDAAVTPPAVDPAVGPIALRFAAHVSLAPVLGFGELRLEGGDAARGSVLDVRVLVVLFVGTRKTDSRVPSQLRTAVLAPFSHRASPRGTFALSTRKPSGSDGGTRHGSTRSRSTCCCSCRLGSRDRR